MPSTFPFVKNYQCPNCDDTEVWDDGEDENGQPINLHDPLNDPSITWEVCHVCDDEMAKEWADDHR